MSQSGARPVCGVTAELSRARGDAQAVDGRLGQALRSLARSHRGSLTNTSVLYGIGREAGALVDVTPSRIDRRVVRVLEALRACEPCPDVGISQAHLQALFARDVGIAIRTFQLWRRLLAALVTFAGGDATRAALVAFAGGDATRAAHAAGYADLAHFSRTCRRMLGYSPTTLRGERAR